MKKKKRIIKTPKTSCKCEIIIGLVGGIGTDWAIVINQLKANFSPTKFTPHEIHLTDAILSGNKSDSDPTRAEKLIGKCNRLRSKSTRNDAMAIIAISMIRNIRNNNNESHSIYIIRQFKKPEEISTLRKIYGKNFILISVYQHRDQRAENLKKSLRSSRSLKETKSQDESISELILRDEKESNNQSGQNTRGTYVEADYFVDMKDIKSSINRFTEILFGYPFNSPTLDEMNMSHAWNASLQSTDLSRQVGAAIADKEGSLIVTGYNEVPKFGGGMYRDEDSQNDHRDFRHGIEINKKKKTELINDLISETKKAIINKLNKNISKKTRAQIDALNSNSLLHVIENSNQKPEILDIIEYHRAVHAEVAAICDAARRGLPLMGATLYTTTFPCHLCAKHIVATGISKVIYVHPYPKSRVIELFQDSIAVNSNNHVTNKVEFIPYMGVAPRRIQKVFNWLKGKREDSEGNTVIWDINNMTSPFLDNRTPLGYCDRETAYLIALRSSVKDLSKFFTADSEILKIIKTAKFTKPSSKEKNIWLDEEIKDNLK